VGGEVCRGDCMRGSLQRVGVVCGGESLQRVEGVCRGWGDLQGWVWQFARGGVSFQGVGEFAGD